LKGSPFKYGFIAGFIFSIIVCFFLDIAFRDSLGGTWLDAVAHDLSLLLKREIPKNSILVIAVVSLIFMLLGFLGGLMGGVAGIIISKFFESLDD
jgi:hypothetical protein